MGVERDDFCEHQAGSDSKITAKCFVELKKQGIEVLHFGHREIYGLSKTNKNIIINNVEEKGEITNKKIMSAF